ncbi:MAG: hypothetical protein GX456_07495, partial [Verrucomicrobia bacterium]|nr:hypothetical protein [Verrucomicrobiota bacterium]
MSVPISHIRHQPETGHTTRFDPANRATEHTPVGCGEESPRSCRRVRRNTDGRERARPRPHQRDDRPYDPFGSRQCRARTFTGLGCTNNVPVPISALVVAKRLECGSLLPLCLHAQTPCLS